MVFKFFRSYVKVFSSDGGAPGDTHLRSKARATQIFNPRGTRIQINSGNKID